MLTAAIAAMVIGLLHVLTAEKESEATLVLLALCALGFFGGLAMRLWSRRG